MDFEKEICRLLKKEVKQEVTLEVPPDPQFGDYAFPCFELAKRLKKNPAVIASELFNKIDADFLEKIEVKGPYLNFFIDHSILIEETVKEILNKKEKYGNLEKKNKTVMVEFFGANTHKAVHIGHVRNMCLGESICRLLESSGFKVIRVNYQGDIGPHVARCIWGYLNLKKKPPKNNKGIWLSNIYSEAYKLSLKDTNIEEEINEINRRLYSGDKKLEKIWKLTRSWCLKDFERLYKEFNVKFNHLYFESEVEKDGVKLSKELIKKKIAEFSEEAVIVNLEKYGLGVIVLVSKDNTALYGAKEIALAKLKLSEYKINQSINIVAREQELYFKQIFKIFELMKLHLPSLHIIYGLVMLPEGKMSSREGTVILYEDLKEKIISLAEKEVEKRHKDWNKKKIQETAFKIAFSALKFSMLKRENPKDMVFDWDEALSFEGDSGPYIQYAYARISSILRKHNKKISKFKVFKTEEKEFSLAKKLYQFPKVLEDASNNHKPSSVSNYLIELVQEFNNFYTYCPVLKAEAEVRKLRLALIEATRSVIKKGLNLLNIETLERM